MSDDGKIFAVMVRNPCSITMYTLDETETEWRQLGSRLDEPYPENISFGYYSLFSADGRILATGAKKAIINGIKEAGRAYVSMMCPENCDSHLSTRLME